MEKWTKISAVAAPMNRPNIDTGALSPVIITKPGAKAWGDRLFASWRYDLEGKDSPDFTLNQPRYKESQILVAGRNFGCGSSRETAVWALAGYGFKAVIAPSFGEIFYDNSFQNGLLLIELPEEEITRICDSLDRANHPELSVDLEAQEIILPGGVKVPFKVPAERRKAMLEGQDELSVLQNHAGDLERYRNGDRIERPWIYEEA